MQINTLLFFEIISNAFFKKKYYCSELENQFNVTVTVFHDFSFLHVLTDLCLEYKMLIIKVGSNKDASFDTICYICSVAIPQAQSCSPLQNNVSIHFQPYTQAIFRKAHRVSVVGRNNQKN